MHLYTLVQAKNHNHLNLYKMMKKYLYTKIIHHLNLENKNTYVIVHIIFIKVHISFKEKIIHIRSIKANKIFRREDRFHLAFKVLLRYFRIKIEEKDFSFSIEIKYI